jgi:hypothetical protein
LARALPVAILPLVAQTITTNSSATDNPELTDAAYVALLSDNTLFGQITPGNSMKWVRNSTPT